MDTTSQAPSAPARNPRAVRGLALFHSGEVSEHGDLFVVRGTGRNYTVSIVEDEPRCDCPDFQARREVCKHGYAVVVHAAKGRCRRQRTAPRPDRRSSREVSGSPGADRAEGGRGSGPARRRGVPGGLDPARVMANVARMGS